MSKYMSEASDFLAECNQIRNLVKSAGPDVFSRITAFKGWSVGDIMSHLHVWNIAADLSLRDREGFEKLVSVAMQSLSTGKGHAGFQNAYFGDMSDVQIFADWSKYFPEMAARFEASDPDQRLKWVGPDMSARSSIIARQMEHWAHAQAIFDVLGQDRENTDRLKNVAHIGVTTFSWSFQVRGQKPPTPKPYVKLKAPSGAIWKWNDAQIDNRIEGTAENFCQVVTQCRNVADTDLRMTGDIANEWMKHAQCFAGGSETPPAPGTRRKESPDT